MRQSLINLNPNLITLDASAISEAGTSFQRVIESLLQAFNDECDSIRQCAKNVVAWLIKTYPSFPTVIRRLSYFHRQELLAFIDEIKSSPARPDPRAVPKGDQRSLSNTPLDRTDAMLYNTVTIGGPSSPA